jgi:hypothetical protein
LGYRILDPFAFNPSKKFSTTVLGGNGWCGSLPP